MRTFCQVTQRIRNLLIAVGVAIVAMLLLFGGGMTLARLSRLLNRPSQPR